jgi:hypothetical protein
MLYPSIYNAVKPNNVYVITNVLFKRKQTSTRRPVEETNAFSMILTQLTIKFTVILPF